MQIQRGVGVSVVLVGLVLLAGCGKTGPRVVPVSGQVLIDGAPLAAGVPGYIQVVPEGTRPASGRIDPQTGRFTLTTSKPEDGCPLGTHEVAVYVNQRVGASVVWLIPEQYGDPKASGLTVTIDGPTDSLLVKLSGPLRLPSRGTQQDSISTEEGVHGFENWR